MHVKTLRSDLWQARAALLAVIILQLFVQTTMQMIGTGAWLLSALEIALLLSLTVSSERRTRRAQAADAGKESELQLVIERGGLSRLLAMTLIGLASIVNFASLVRLIISLLLAGKAQGVTLLADALDLFATNVIIFGLWYWEMDRGGPWRRASGRPAAADFLFPQMNLDPVGCKEAYVPHWRPRFIDYLYVAFTNATAFSPTDTLPLSAAAKILMMVQAAVSLMTIAIVAARAVNILA